LGKFAADLSIEDQELPGHQRRNYSLTEVEAANSDLTDELRARFGEHVEFWITTTGTFYEISDPQVVDAARITEALRVTFIGFYDSKEADILRLNPGTKMDRSAVVGTLSHGPAT